MLWIAAFMNLLDGFFPILMTFIIIIISISIMYLPIDSMKDNKLSSETKSTDKDLTNEIMDLKTKLESTAKDIEEIKKIIEE
jgi:hypothetical protein